MFVSAPGNCPLTTAAEWTNNNISPALTTNQTAYTSSLLADSSLGGLKVTLTLPRVDA